MMKMLLPALLLFAIGNLRAQQTNYRDSIKDYQESYLMHHEVVKEADKQFFRFFAPDKHYRINASFKKLNDSTGFIMKTSGTKDKKFFRYGSISLKLKRKAVHLTIYRSEQLMNDSAYKDYLFLPFTDATSGAGSYGGGRYIDLNMQDIIDNRVLIDFNKAYNPYCAYVNGYNCPIPPRENHIPFPIKAGEKDFGKSH
jgi:uncharacterized protein (DUF1684 family)